MAVTDYADITELVNAMLTATTAAEFTKIAADAEAWKLLHGEDTIPISTAWEGFEMRRTVLFPDKEG